MRNKTLPVLFAAFFMFFSLTLLSQGYSEEHGEHGFDISFWFGILELPFLFVCVYYSFKTASALKGGIFGVI